jgi:hypothetical protein
MAFNGSGAFSRLYNWVTDRSNGVKIRADRTDEEMAGFAAGLSNCICRDGQSTISADIPFNNKKITGLADAAGATHAMNRQSGDARWMFHPKDLTQETTLSDTDEFPFYDASADVDRTTTFSNLVAKLRAAGVEFASGTRMLFAQTSAPTGWTKETGSAYNDAALRMTTGAVAPTGGATAFTTVFVARTLAASQMPNMTLTVTDPGHAHHGPTDSGGFNAGAGGTLGARALGAGDGGTATTGIGVAIDNAARGGGSQQTIDFATKYVDAIIATKD